MNRSKTVRFALYSSLPVLFGYLFLGIAFGILLEQAGYGFLWALLISLIVYAGSLQFVLVTFLSGGTALPTVALMTLFINSRHIFYGLSFVECFKKMGKRFLYMIFSLTDETYSVLCSLKPQEGVDTASVRFFIALFNQCYWILGSVLGSVIGRLLPFSFRGIEFSMTALFVVLFIEQWKSAKSHLPAFAGLSCGLLFLLLLGADRFLLPSLLAAVTLLLLSKPIIASVHEQGEQR
jgi:4-azaleucine resistance transporter AzlC